MQYPTSRYKYFIKHLLFVIHVVHCTLSTLSSDIPILGYVSKYQAGIDTHHVTLYYRSRYRVDW